MKNTVPKQTSAMTIATVTGITYSRAGRIDLSFHVETNPDTFPRGISFPPMPVGAPA